MLLDCQQKCMIGGFKDHGLKCWSLRFENKIGVAEEECSVATSSTALYLLEWTCALGKSESFCEIIAYYLVKKGKKRSRSQRLVFNNQDIYFNHGHIHTCYFAYLSVRKKKG